MIAAETEKLSIDQYIPNEIRWYFPNESNIHPEKSDFAVLNYVPMSNKLGERWAVITVENRSSGTRILTQNHLLGLFADGVRKMPKEFRRPFEGKESLSVSINFGINKFPILGVYSN